MALFSDILLSVDFDRTLTAPDSSIPQRNIDAIRKADSLGIRVAISTGRMIEDASDFIRRYDLPCMLIAANGARAASGPMPGGEMLYRTALPHADILCLTEVDDTPENADAFFPEFAKNEWEVIEQEEHTADEKHAYNYRFVTYLRRL